MKLTSIEKNVCIAVLQKTPDENQYYNTNDEELPERVVFFKVAKTTRKDSEFHQYFSHFCSGKNKGIILNHTEYAALHQGICDLFKK